MPDPEITDYTARICRLEVEEVGSRVPCAAARENHAGEMGKTKEYTYVRYCFYKRESYPAMICEYSYFATLLIILTRSSSYNDYGSIDLGRACPLYDPHSTTDEHQFKASIVYELPEQLGVPATGSKMVFDFYFNS